MACQKVTLIGPPAGVVAAAPLTLGTGAGPTVEAAVLAAGDADALAGAAAALLGAAAAAGLLGAAAAAGEDTGELAGAAGELAGDAAAGELAGAAGDDAGDVTPATEQAENSRLKPTSAAGLRGLNTYSFLS